MDGAQIGQRELGTDKGERNRRVGDLGAQPVERVADDRVVVECEIGDLVGDEPLDPVDDGRLAVTRDEGPVDDGDSPIVPTGAAINRAEGVQLLEVGLRDADRALQRLPCGRDQVMLRRERAAGERPLAFVGLPVATHQRQPQRERARLRVRSQREDHRRDGEIDPLSGRQVTCELLRHVALLL